MLEMPFPIMLIGAFAASLLGLGAAQALPVAQDDKIAQAGINPLIEPRPRVPPPSAQVALSYGTFSSKGITLRLSLDVFELTDRESGWAVQGDFAIVDGILTLTNPEPLVESVTFPVICRVERFGPGIRLRDETGQCEVYHDMILREER
jgi:hypothetical protein